VSPPDLKKTKGKFMIGKGSEGGGVWDMETLQDRHPVKKKNPI